MRTRHAPAPGQLALGFVDDAQAIRDALVIDLRVKRERARFINEMGMNHGAARIDLAVIDDTLDGYEVKGPNDDLRRLEGQAVAYSQVFDRLTLVATERHLKRGEELVPPWWGLTLVDTVHSLIRPVRQPGANPVVDPLSMARLLWRSELASVLEARTGRRPLGSTATLRRRLAAESPSDEVRALVRRCLTSRASWPAAG